MFRLGWISLVHLYYCAMTCPVCQLHVRAYRINISQQAELIDAKIHSAVSGISDRVDKFGAELDTIRAENRNLRNLIEGR